MPAIDTIAAFATEGAAAAFPTALAAANGDELTVRSFPTGQTALLEGVTYDAGGGEKVRITSPLLHDDVTGLTWEPSDHPSLFLMPREAGTPLRSNDNLTVDGGIAAAGTIVAGLHTYYSQIDGVNQRLAMWGDVSGNIRYIKTVEVDLNAVAVGAWTDTKITVTEDQLHAGSDYAVLGYQVSEAVDLVGVKGSWTGNLRICGPGAVSTLDISEYFIRMSELKGTPHIPVFNADNRYASYVSAFHSAAIAGGAAHAYLILAELQSKFGG